MLKKVLDKVIAIILIMVLTLFNFIYVGTSTISYAIGVLTNETNNKNVKFVAYFKTAEGKKVDVKEEKIDNSGMKMYLGISVENAGYFNGNIEVLDSNFTLKNTNTSEKINKIENNKITLNQISAGELVELELGIEPKNENKIDSGLLNMESKIKLTGTYTDSNAKKIDIDSTREIKLILEDPYEEGKGLNINAGIITNKIYNINNENKRLVQLKINSNLEENKYPVKSTSIEVGVPDGVENVEVISLGTKATNGKESEEFSENNWNYTKESNKVEIKVENKEENGKISWNKNAKDEFVITYIVPENIDLKDKDIKIKDIVELYNNKNTIKTVEGKITINEEKDGTVELKTANDEKDIYKGNIYSKQERDIKTKTNIIVNYPELLDKVEIKENQATYITEKTELTANVQYRRTTVNKEKMQEILGQEGTIEIEDQNGNNVSTITKDSKVDESGNVEVEYESGVKAITIRTSKPENTGVLKIEHVKTFAGEEYTTEEIKEFKQLNENVNLLNNNATYNSKIELKETTTKAKLKLSRESISTFAKNESIEMKATLVTNNEKYDLYKNPTIRIELPSQVESIKVNSINLLYEEELKIKNAQLVENNGVKTIEIVLEGEQTAYLDSKISEGATIIVNANVTVNQKVASSSEKIKMTIENQKAISYENNPVEKTIEILAPTGMVVANTMEKSNLTAIGTEETKTKVVEVGKEAKQEEVKIDVINNNDAEVTNVNVLGKFPTKNTENTMETKITKEIKTQGIDENKVKVYYSEKENVTADLTAENQWQDAISDSKQVKSYLITVNNMQQGEMLSASYGMQIPEGLNYNQKAYQTYQVNYEDTLTGEQETVKSAKLGMTTGNGPELKATLTATVGGEEVKDGAKVYGGEVIKYKVKIENVGTADATDVVLNRNLPEGTEYNTEPKDNKSTIVVESTENINTIKSGETIEKEYEVVVNNQINGTNNIINKVSLNYSNQNAETNQLSLIAEKGDISVRIYQAVDYKNEGFIVGLGSTIRVKIKNLTNQDKDNVVVQPVVNELLEIGDFIINQSEEEINIDKDKNNIVIKQLPKNSEIEVGVEFVSKESENKNNKIGIISVNIIDESNIYKSNDLTYIISKNSVEITQTSATDGQYVKSGDDIIYIFKIKNTGENNVYINFLNSISDKLNITKIVLDGKEINRNVKNSEIDIDDELANNYIYLDYIFLEVGETKEIMIYAKVADDVQEEDVVQILNYATVTAENVEVKSNSVTHIIDKKEDNNTNIEDNEDNIIDEDENRSDIISDDNNNNSSDNNSGDGNNDNSSKDNNNDSNSSSQKTYLISGNVWLDENENGKKDINEELLNNIKVKLLDSKTNKVIKNSQGKDIEVETDKNGFYTLENVENGKYIVVFEYDTTKYIPTKYKVEGAGDSESSKAVLNNLKIDGEEKSVANTDTIIIKDKSIGNINLGLKEAKDFDLGLEKTITKVVAQNADGTKTYNIKNKNTAKVELRAKNMKNTNLVVEYEIKVTNNGEVEGYAKNIVDYIPSGLKFNSELNKDWYMKNNNLYNTSLANEKILPGESKTIKLVLTKTVTKTSAEIINNTAEIAEAYNSSGLKDVNSTPNNKVKDENDMGSADLIITVATGKEIIYITIGILIVLIIIGTSIYYLKKKGSEK